jgi:menaquinone-dependent protoporphyrinogen oxidase
VSEDGVNILIAYGTTEGQTRKIVEWATKYIRDRGHAVLFYNSADELESHLDLNVFQAFVIAASVHQEQHQKAIKNFATAHRELLNVRLSAFISVSLSAVLEETRPEAQSYVDRFVSLTGWQPHMTLLLGGALRFTEYDYFQEQVVKFIVIKRGLASATGSDREFTDWNLLASFLDEFLERAAARNSCE